MKNLMKPYFALALMLISLAYSCQKDNSGNNGSQPDTQAAADNVFAEAVVNDVTTITAQSEDNGTAGGSNSGILLLSPCATVTVDFAANPDRLTIDYGKNNCLCLDGKYRRGKIVVGFTGFYRDSASVHAIGFDNYYVNDYKVEGSQTVVNKGHNSSGHLVFEVKSDMIITDTAARKLTFISTRSREWVAGESTDGLTGWMDDVYSITGTASGTGFSGQAYTVDIKSPVIFSCACKWLEAGKLDFSSQGQLLYSIDYGNGDCDNKATVTILGFDINIIME